MTRAHLRPCPGCSRHVRVSEGACPFCAASLDASFRAAPAPVPPSRRLSRAALFAFGTGTLVLAPAAIVTVALGTDCSGSSAYGAPACEDVNCDAVEPLEDSGDRGRRRSGAAAPMRVTAPSKATTLPIAPRRTPATTGAPTLETPPLRTRVATRGPTQATQTRRGVGSSSTILWAFGWSGQRARIEIWQNGPRPCRASLTRSLRPSGSIADTPWFALAMNRDPLRCTWPARQAPRCSS